MLIAYSVINGDTYMKWYKNRTIFSDRLQLA